MAKGAVERDVFWWDKLEIFVQRYIFKFLVIKHLGLDTDSFHQMPDPAHDPGPQNTSLFAELSTIHFGTIAALYVLQ